MSGAAYHRAVLTRDADAIAATMAQNVRFHSPTKRSPFEGREIARFLFSQLFDVLEDFRFGEIVENERVSVLFFTCRIGGKEAEGCDVLRFNAAGEIEDFRVLIRPLNALAALNEAMGARLAKAFPV